MTPKKGVSFGENDVQEAPANPTNQQLRKVFGDSVVDKFHSDKWKLREEAVGEAASALGDCKNAEKTFETTLIFASIAIGDSVQQVYFASLALIRALFESSSIKVPKSCRDTTDPPQYLHTIFSALLQRAASSNERSAMEANNTIVAIAFNTSIGYSFLSSLLLQKPGKEKNWRPALARLRLLGKVSYKPDYIGKNISVHRIYI